MERASIAKCGNPSVSDDGPHRDAIYRDLLTTSIAICGVPSGDDDVTERDILCRDVLTTSVSTVIMSVDDDNGSDVVVSPKIHLPPTSCSSEPSVGARSVEENRVGVAVHSPTSVIVVKSAALDRRLAQGHVGWRACVCQINISHNLYG